MINLFMEQVAKHGDRIALSEPASGRTDTYSQLDENARRVAAKLKEQGIRRGDAVMITAARGIGFIEAMFGILMAGGAYVPLSDHYPADRKAYIQSDCGAKIVIDDAFIYDAYGFEPISEICGVKPDDTALIIYTSGSTGKPKGVIHDHESIKNEIMLYSGILELKDDDIYGINVAFYFILSVGDIFTGLANGITEIIIPDELKGDPESLADFIDKHKITSAVIMPKVLRYFTRKGGSLRTVVSCGERLSQIAPDGYRLLNCYGMTELTGECLTFEVDKAYDNTPIGKPSGNVSAYVLDENGNIADEGEICIAGHMAKGYLHRPEETARAFTPNPFKNIDGHDVLIHTGDLGRRLHDGNILYLNRKDWMLKINGQRVEPGEIESAIREIDGISDTAVKDFIDATGQIFLAAYYISDSEKNEKELKKALSSKLPKYMVPEFFVRLEKLPVNANGKLDRMALPKPEIDLRRAEYKAPENDRQRLIAQAFEEILGIENIGINDEFFALGGDSIKVLMLQKALREKGIEISASSVFTSQTPKLLSETVGDGSELSSYKGEEADSYPLTRAQMSIYLDCQDEKGTAYNNVFSLLLPSDMADETRLKSAVETVLSDYPILGASVKIIDGVPSLVPSGRKITAEIKQTEIADKNTLAKSVDLPFDLENDLLTRAVIFKTPAGLCLVLVMHHIICDGTSASIIIGNIAAVYGGEPPAKEEMSNLTLAQYEAAHPEITQADNEVYRKMLDNIESDTELYSDDDPELADFKGKLGVYDTTLFTQRHELSGRLIASLSERQLTESTLFMSAYAYMLRLFCNQQNVLFFTGENGRHDPVLQNTVGMMVHNLPVLAHIDENADSADFMTDMQKSFHELVAHDGADIPQLCGEYGIRPDCFFVYQGDMLSGVNVDGRYIPMEMHVSEDVMTSLTLHVLKQNSGDYRLRFEYAAEKLSAETVKRMAKVYTMIAAGLCGGGKLKDIRLVTDENIDEIERFNQTETDYPAANIVSMFRKQAAKYPDRPAVRFKDETLTYSQIDDISERIANKIRSLGIGGGDVVSILIPRCAYMVTASLGALKSGAAYQPLDPAYPADRLAFMMADADAKLLIADEELLSKVPEYKGAILLTKDIPDLPNRGRIEKDPEPNDLFTLLYTSGSTGVPKGVMLEHGNIANFCCWYRDFYKMDEHSRAAAYASYGFDANMMDMYPALTAGACVCIVEEEIRLDLIELEKWFDRLGITHSFMTTQIGRQFYSMASPEKLKYLSVGGEKLVPIRPKDTNTRFYNGYGPTECTIFTTVMPVKRIYERVPIGKAISNYKCYVVDENLRRLPPLVPGELLIAGRGVARGYLNRDDLTEKAFIRNPFSNDEDYKRAYRSGDVVRLLPNGEIDFIGRNDGQVKVRGFRIELTEVEGVIREFEGVTDATVQAFEDEETGEKYIAAYIVGDGEINISALNDFIIERKPSYMVPSVTMQIPSIPLNQNQKVNKRELPKPVRKQDEIIPPQNETQQKIFDIIAEVLGYADFGITTDIYDAGLSSIGAVRLNVLLSKAFDAPVKTSDLKENNTVEKLERFFARAEKSEVFETRPDYPLTKTQEGIFVEAIAHPETTIYNIPVLLKLGGGIDENRLKTAVIRAINAHPYIKTRLFMDDDGNIRQRRTDGDLSFDEISIETVVADDIESIKPRLAKPYNLLGGRLFSAKLIKADGLYLFLEMHHIISDGASLSIILRDISRAYDGEELAAESYSSFEAALSEEKARASEEYAKAKDYYASLLGGCDTDCLPKPDKNDPETKAGFMTLRSSLSPKEVEAYCQKHKVTPNGFFNAVFGFVLGRYNNADDAVFTTIYNGRSDSRTENAVGMFVKTLPVYCDIDGQKTVLELVKETGSQLLDSMENDVYSFAEISREYGVSADIMVAYQDSGISEHVIGGEKCGVTTLSLDAAKSKLSVDITIKDGAYEYAAEYYSNLYSDGFIKTFMSSVDAAAASFIVSAYISEVSMLSSEDAEAIKSFNDTDYPIELVNVNKLFEAQAAAHPERTAVISCGKSLTYGELNERANRIARSLIEKGVRLDEPVGMLLPRDVNIPAAEYGIMKAGGAFLPMLPDYPDDRVDFCLRDSHARFVITTDELKQERAELFGGKPYTALALSELLQNENASDPETDIPENSLAYCIYTSGSTGTPKGVMIEHGSLCNFVNANPKNKETFEYVNGGKTALAIAAVSFDVSVMEIHISLCNGMTVCIATDEEIHDPLALAKLIEENNVEVMSGTPSFMTNIAEIPQTAKALSRIKMYDLGAEAFTPPLYGLLRKASPDAVIVNGYGPTETTVSCIAKVMTSGENITIGNPAANVKAYIIDKHRHILPAGAKGELAIGGLGVGRGYVGLEKKTAEAFIELENGRAYRSGDIARYLPNGEIEFFGRADNQVKLRGLRVELDEIMNVMCGYPDVTNAVVIVKGEGQQQYLCGYFTASKQIEKQALTEHLKKSLAHYMVPSVLIQLDKLPMTKNGKIDKKALPEPDAAQQRSAGRKAANDTEQIFCDMFAAVLGLDAVYADDDFFELGGTSLLASKIAVRCMTQNIPVVYKDIFDNTTPEKLAALVNASETPVAEAKTAVETTADEEHEPLYEVLKYNTAQHIGEINYTDIGNVLVTGATGFLGAHVLKQLIDSGAEKIFCLARNNGKLTAEERVKMMLMFYFDDTYDELFESGITVIDSDITSENLTDKLRGYDFDTVINCAACVKHFTNSDILEKVNVEGVENLIAACLELDKSLVQISTVSVGGESINGSIPEYVKLSESMLEFGQNLDNKYVNTKHRAEKAVLTAVRDKELRGKVIRVGNLMSREKDGEFQANFRTNNFMNTLRAYAALGCFPISELDTEVEFSPIDCVAAAILKLAGTPPEFTMFHAYNSHFVHMDNVIEGMRENGIIIKNVSDEEFEKRFNEMLSSDEKSMEVSALISYKENDAEHRMIESVNKFTVKALYKLGFSWPLINENYISRAINALVTLGFFDNAADIK